MEAARPFPQLVAAPAPSLMAVPAQFPRFGGPLYTRGGGPHGSPPSSSSMHDNPDPDPDLNGEPPIGEVVGAGAVGALAGEGTIENTHCEHVFYLYFLATALGLSLAIGKIPSRLS